MSDGDGNDGGDCDGLGHGDGDGGYGNDHDGEVMVCDACDYLHCSLRSM